MRSISPTLLAAQKSASSEPYLRVVLYDRVGGVRRLAFDRLYTGDEPEGYHAAAMPSDGSLIRSRVDGGRVYYQRVTSPGPGSTFSSWTDLTAVASADTALCADGSRVLLFYVDTNGTTIRVRESTDHGATLGSPVTAASAAGTVTWLAADVKSNGDSVLVYSVGATVYRAKRMSGSWGSPVAWTNSVASVSGLACHHQADWNVAVAGTDSDEQAYVWTCIFGDGIWQTTDTWSALRELTRASAGSSVTFRAPFLGRPATQRATFVEKYTGTTAYSRAYHTYGPPPANFAENRWREPIPFDLDTEYGLAIAFDINAAWLCTPYGVWRGPLTVDTLDVTADVLEADVTDRPFGGALRLVIRNDDGRYSGAPSPLRAGAEVEIEPGYQTSFGAESSEGPRYWIESVERITGGGRGAVEIRGHNAWGILQSQRLRRQFAWEAGEATVFDLLSFFFGRAGLDFSSVSASLPALTLRPAFTVHAGESSLTAVRRVLRPVQDVMFQRAEVAFLKNPLATEAVAYSYGTDHVLLAGRYLDVAPPSNRAQVFGEGVFAEAFDWPRIQESYDRTTQVIDANLTTAGEAADRADAVLRGAAIDAIDGRITVRPNCAQELYDVIDVTDATAGLDAAKRRVLGLRLRYSAQKGEYTQELELGGV